ncbi:MAG: chloride channel protein [Chthonomonadales bacterium]
MKEVEPPKLSDEDRWYAEHMAILISTVKWAFLGTIAGVCVGAGTRAFLWSLSASTKLVAHLDAFGVRSYLFLPLALPACVWLIRNFAPAAKGHGTEAVIAAVHEQAGRVEWQVAPIKLLATLLTLAFGGSVGKEGPCAQIGASITSLFADLLRLNDRDRRRLVICGIGAGFAAVFGTPISGALFGVEVLYLGRIEYPVLFPCIVAGIVAHLVCGARPYIPQIPGAFVGMHPAEDVPLALVFGAAFGLAALLLIEAMRLLERSMRRFERHPYLVAAGGGIVLAVLYSVFGTQYAGLGVGTIEAAMSGAWRVVAYAAIVKIVATAVTLETGGSGGIVTPLFFIGATSGAALAHALHLPEGLFAAYGLIGVLAAAANTPIAATVMGMEMLPGPIGVYAALCACVAFLVVGHRSVYASQKIGMSKSAGLEVTLDVSVGELDRAHIRVRKDSLAQRILHVRIKPRSRRSE